MDPLTLLLITTIVSLVGTAVSADTSMRSQNKQVELQEDAQAFTNEQRVAQNEYEQQMHEFNLVNDPALQRLGLEKAGMSSAAAIQAIAGAPATGWTPTASNNGSPLASLSPINLNNPLTAISDYLGDYFNKEKQVAETGQIGSTIRFNEQMIKESEFRIKEIGQNIKASQNQIAISQRMIACQEGLTQSEIQVNFAKLKEISANVQKTFAQIENINADSVRIALDQLKIQAETENILANTALQGEQIKFVNAQTQGQDISNIDASLSLELKSLKTEVSLALGIDFNDELTDQIVMAMALGEYETVDHLINAAALDSNDYIGSFGRLMHNSGIGKTYTRSNLYRSNSFTPIFQPQLHNGQIFDLHRNVGKRGSFGSVHW